MYKPWSAAATRLTILTTTSVTRARAVLQAYRQPNTQCHKVRTMSGTTRWPHALANLRFLNLRFDQHCQPDGSAATQSSR